MRSLGLPTRTDDWRRMARTTRLVIGHPRWFAVAVVGAFAVVSLFVVANDGVYLATVVVGGTLPLVERLQALAGVYPLVGGSGHLAGDVLLYLTSAVLGINVALVGYHLTEHEVGLRSGSGSAAGAVLAGIGAGCPACGIGVAASTLSITGVAGGLAALPMDGREIMLLALVIAFLSIHWTVEGMRGGEFRGCPVDFAAAE